MNCRSCPPPAAADKSFARFRSYTSWWPCSVGASRHYYRKIQTPNVLLTTTSPSPAGGAPAATPHSTLTTHPTHTAVHDIYLWITQIKATPASSSRGHERKSKNHRRRSEKAVWGLSMSSNPRAIHRAIGSQRERHFYHASNPKREGEEEEGAEKESERTEPPKVHMPPPRLRQIRRRRCAVV